MGHLREGTVHGRFLSDGSFLRSSWRPRVAFMDGLKAGTRQCKCLPNQALSDFVSIMTNTQKHNKFDKRNYLLHSMLWTLIKSSVWSEQ